MGLQVPLSAWAGVSVNAEGFRLDVAAFPLIALLSHEHHSLVQVAIHRPVLGSLKSLLFISLPFSFTPFFSHLSVAKSDCKPAKVAVDDLDGVVLRARDVERVGGAGNHLLHLQTPRIVNNNVCGGRQFIRKFQF